MTDQAAPVAGDNKHQTPPDQTPVAEREPAPRRRAHYPGDKRPIMGDLQWLGPDRRGIMWRPCHVNYNTETDRSEVIFAPVAPHDVAKIPGLAEKIRLVQQMQMTAAGAVAQIGGM